MAIRHSTSNLRFTVHFPPCIVENLGTFLWNVIVLQNFPFRRKIIDLPSLGDHGSTPKAAMCGGSYTFPRNS